MVEHKVRSRQSYHTHRQRRNADEGLKLVLEKIAKGNLEVVEKVDPPPTPPSMEGSWMYWVMIIFLVHV